MYKRQVFLVTLLLVFGCTFLVNQNQQRREKLKAAYTAESTISRIEVQLNRYLVESNLVKKSIEEGLTISDKPVSYTHLDVYKRQTLHWDMTTGRFRKI